MSQVLHIVSVNQDPGISPARAKGAAIHLNAMRQAFKNLGAAVGELDESESPAVRLRLEDIHREKPIDLLYERYALGKSAAAEFAREHGIPYALEVNAPLADEQARWRSQVERAQDADAGADRICFGQADFILAVSSEVARYAASRGGRENSIHVIPNGIDTTLFNLDAGQRPEPGPEFQGHDADIPFRIGFHGRERPWHGFDRMVDVVQALLERALPVHLQVIGHGDFSALQRLPEQAYTRLPWVAHEELPAHLAKLDAMPFTYSPDLPCYFSPLKLMEGMACGVVPVVPDLGDLPSIVRNGWNGLVYPAGRDDALLEALVSLMTHRAFCARLAGNAAQTACAHDWRGIAQTVLDQTLGTRNGMSAQGASGS